MSANTQLNKDRGTNVTEAHKILRLMINCRQFLLFIKIRFQEPSDLNVFCYNIYLNEKLFGVNKLKKDKFSKEKLQFVIKTQINIK